MVQCVRCGDSSMGQMDSCGESSTCMMARLDMKIKMYRNVTYRCVMWSDAMQLWLISRNAVNYIRLQHILSVHIGSNGTKQMIKMLTPVYNCCSAVHKTFMFDPTLHGYDHVRPHPAWLRSWSTPPCMVTIMLDPTLHGYDHVRPHPAWLRSCSTPPCMVTIMFDPTLHGYDHDRPYPAWLLDPLAAANSR